MDTTTFKGIDEQDYINISDLNKIRMAKAILADIILQNSIIIPPVDFQKVMTLLSSWEQMHYKQIVVK